MNYTSPQIVAAFLDANELVGWSARSYTTEESDQVHFTCPSTLVKLVYDCREGCFLVTFQKLVAGWGDYTKAIARACHYVLKTLQAGGLDFTPPEDETKIAITVYLGKHGQTKVHVAPSI